MTCVPPFHQMFVCLFFVFVFVLLLFCFFVLFCFCFVFVFCFCYLFFLWTVFIMKIHNSSMDMVLFARRLRNLGVNGTSSFRRISIWSLCRPWGSFETGGGSNQSMGVSSSLGLDGAQAYTPSLFMQRDMKLDSPWGFILWWRGSNKFMGISRGLGLDGAQVHTPFPVYAEGYESGFPMGALWWRGLKSVYGGLKGAGLGWGTSPYSFS